MFIVIEILCVLILAMILSTVIIDEKKTRERSMRMVTLSGYWRGKERRGVGRMNVMLWVKYFTNGIPLDGKALDVSTKSIRLLLDEKIEKGTPLRLEIKTTPREHPIRTKGEVVWSTEAKEAREHTTKKFFNTGIKFSEFHGNDENKLFAFIQRLEH